MAKPYKVVWWRGGNFDVFTKRAIRDVERRLGYPVHITQGSYNTSVGASGGTHGGGGAVDTYPRKATEYRVWRRAGWFTWPRFPSQGPWARHDHGILPTNKKLSAAALNQVAEYRAGRNGLVSRLWDTFWRPAFYRPFEWRKLHDPRVAPKHRLSFLHMTGRPTKRLARKTVRKLVRANHIIALVGGQGSLKPARKQKGYKLVVGKKGNGRRATALVVDDRLKVRQKALLKPLHKKWSRNGKPVPRRKFIKAKIGPDKVIVIVVNMPPKGTKAYRQVADYLIKYANKRARRKHPLILVGQWRQDLGKGNTPYTPTWIAGKIKADTMSGNGKSSQILISRGVNHKDWSSKQTPGFKHYQGRLIFKAKKRFLKKRVAK